MSRKGQEGRGAGPYSTLWAIVRILAFTLNEPGSIGRLLAKEWHDPIY